MSAATSSSARVDALGSLLDRGLPGLEATMEALGEPRYRARQVWAHLMAGELAPATWTDLPIRLRNQLAAFPVAPLEVGTTLASVDGLTHKSLLRAADGTSVEAVLMRYPAGSVDPMPGAPGDPSGAPRAARRTVCVSTQAGCAMGCRFCATARLGLERNLSAAEMVAQVLHVQSLARRLAVPGEPARLTNVVFMGMGEPFANYQRMREAILLLTSREGFGLGARHITVSTVGLVPGIRRFTAEGWQVGLAVSLHAPDDVLRSRLMPVNLHFPLADLMAACRDYVAATRRRLTFEYVLIAGINDSATQAQALASLLRGLLCHVNLIPMNPIGDDRLRRSSPARVRAFRQTLGSAGIACTVRQERGVDIHGACGQLRRYDPAAGGG